MNDIDIRHLRYFAAVAQTRHFTRAAERLGIRQPPLSMQIKQLEAAVGTRLFRRLSRGVELTEAGQSFQADVQDLLARLERAVLEARRRAEGQSGRLRVGFAGAVYFHPAIPAAIRDYRGRYPDVLLLPEQSNTPAMLDGLLSQHLDVAFIRPPVEPDPRLVLRQVIEEDMLVALPSGHRLDAPQPLALAEASGETFIVFPREIGPGLYDAIMAACHEAGFNPQLGQDASQIATIVPMVAAGFGIAIVPRSVSQIHVEGVTYRAIAGRPPRASIALAFRRDDPSPRVAAFVASACASAG